MLVAMATGYVKQWVSKEIGREAVVGQWNNGTMGPEDNGCIEQLIWWTMGPQDNGNYGNGLRQTIKSVTNRDLGDCRIMDDVTMGL